MKYLFDMKKLYFSNKKILYSIIFILAILLFLLAVDNNGIWSDEIFTMRIIDSTFRDAVKIVINDVHPPLYYILLNIFVEFFDILFNTSRIVLAKYFSIITFVILMCTAANMLWHRFGYKSAYIYLICLFGTRGIMYAVEIRMYSLAMLFVTLAYLYAYDILQNNNNKKSWVLFTIMSILGAYTHYYAVICLSLVYLYLLYYSVKNNCFKNWIFCFVSTCLSYLPWLFVLSGQLTKVNEGWNNTFRLIDLVTFAAFPFYTNEIISTIVIAFISILILVLTVFEKDISNKSFIKIAQWNPVYVGIIGIIISLITQKFFTGKYLLPGWGVFWLGITLYLCNSKYKKVLVSIILVLNIFTYYVSFNKENSDREGYYVLQSYLNADENIYMSGGVREICDYYGLYKYEYTDAKYLDETSEGYIIAFKRDNIDDTGMILLDEIMLGGTNTVIYKK